MLDPIAVFEKQFEPYRDGYLFYPNRKSGGKFVTKSEYEELLAKQRRVASRGIFSPMVLVVVAVLTGVAIAAEFLNLSEKEMTIGVWAIAFCLIGYTLWVTFAPWRLLKDRPSVTPPRSSVEHGRRIREMVSWPVIGALMFVSGAIFISQLGQPDDTIDWWARLLGSFFVAATCTGISVQKLRDGRTAEELGPPQ